MKRKKLSYYDPTILVMEAQVRWDQLMAAEQVTHEELQMSLFQGEWQGRSREGGEGRAGEGRGGEREWK